MEEKDNEEFGYLAGALPAARSGLCCQGPSSGPALFSLATNLLAWGQADVVQACLKSSGPGSGLPWHPGPAPSFSYSQAPYPRGSLCLLEHPSHRGPTLQQWLWASCPCPALAPVSGEEEMNNGDTMSLYF